MSLVETVLVFLLLGFTPSKVYQQIRPILQTDFSVIERLSGQATHGS